MKVILELSTRDAPMLPAVEAHCPSWRGLALAKAVVRHHSRISKSVIRRMPVKASPSAVKLRHVRVALRLEGLDHDRCR